MPKHLDKTRLHHVMQDDGAQLMFCEHKQTCIRGTC